jgi:2-keto-4-pentenoate hydratase/2-oxohepta-3-ene-1,7-dioic acid hydratase in catechol pathway
MLFPVVPLIAHISTQFSLLPGDVILTGTPKGVGPLQSGQILQLTLEDRLSVSTRVI